jgi:hypothetical protein
MLIPLTVAVALTFPALSVHKPLAVWPGPSVLSVMGAVQLAMPERLSAPVNVTVTLVLFHPAPFGAGDAAAVAVGGVMSILTVTDADRVSPAPFTALHVKVVPAVSVVRAAGSQPVLASELMPDVGSLTFQLTVTFVLFQPAAVGAGDTLGVTIGGVRSIRTVTETELVKPAPFTAEQVNVTPAVSADSEDVPQPELEVIPDSGSVTLQLTLTGTVVFQPKAFGGGFTVATITGGVVSPLALITVSCVGKVRPARSAVARLRVFPAASDRNTLATVHVPFSLPLGNVAVALPDADVLTVKLADAFCVVRPEGLIKSAWKFVTPEISSVA